MIVRFPPLIAVALLAGATVASAAKPPLPSLTMLEVRQTLERVVIPKLEFREASFREALDFLCEEAQRLDPERRRIPFHIRLDPKSRRSNTQRSP